MANISTKILVDCSKPTDHPEHSQVVELTDTELKQRDKDAARGSRAKPPNPLDVLAEAVEKAENLDDMKTAILAFATR